MPTNISSEDARLLFAKWKDESTPVGLVVFSLGGASVHVADLFVSDIKDSTIDLRNGDSFAVVPYSGAEGQVVLRYLEPSELPKDLFLAGGPKFNSCLRISINDNFCVLFEKFLNSPNDSR